MLHLVFRGRPRYPFVQAPTVQAASARRKPRRQLASGGRYAREVLVPADKMPPTRPVPGLDGYEVSADGQVFSYRVRGQAGKRSPNARLLAPKLTRSNRPFVAPAGKTIDVARLVLAAWGDEGDRPDKVAVARNGDNRDLRLENLCWGEPPTGERHPRARITVEQARAIKRRLATGEKPSEVSAALGVSLPVVSGIASGNAWRSVSPLPPEEETDSC